MTRDKDEDPHRSPLSTPSKQRRLSSDDRGGSVTMAVPAPLTLGLRLGVDNAVEHRNGNGNGNVVSKPAFTFMQLQELEHQALIYKYMSAGVPVPVHLVLPIWKSVAASSFGPQHYPSLMGLGSLCFDYRNSMEPEPGRCRRTDGKKWRCSRDVVPGQKYCERHVHRGRGRSRKPVEGAGAALSAAYVHASSNPSMVQVQPKDNGTTTGTGAQVPVSIPASSIHFLARGSSNSSTTDSVSVSPPRLGFSPTSVLHNAAVCKTGQIN
ncbi:Growth-regulating factor [Rhynchospora pubera]|uniref:Growth-regulating factor n=1 Tax=Rhynchospora pubera TaxID=906938 RepID=A0AAV8BUA6_9POAL|nr:Growth-regulating factor [Rhynchospora pubera]